LAQQINETIAADSNQSFRLHSDRQIVELTAKNCSIRDEKRLQLTDDVVIVERQLQADSPGRTLRCQKAFLALEGDDMAPTLTLDMQNAKWQIAPGTESLLARHIVRGLILPAAVTDNFKLDDILKEITPQAISAALHAKPGPNLVFLQSQLQKQIALTLAEIGAETHSRLVFGVGCITLIMIGIGLGIVLKDGHLLTAFAASAIPALALVSCIMMGKNITKNPESAVLSGVMLMWAGLIVLTLLALEMYRRLLKH